MRAITYILKMCDARISLEILCVGILLLTNLLIENEFQSFAFRENEIFRLVPIAISSLLLTSCYIVVRLFVPAIAALLLAVSFNLALSSIHYQKFALTNEALSWTDLIAVANYSIVLHYMQPIHILLGIAAACASLLVGMFFFRRHPLKLSQIKIFCSKIGLATLLCMTPIGPMVGNATSTTLSHIFEGSGMPYFFWDWPKNVERNGLLAHLIQTSERNIPPRVTGQEILQYRELDRATDLAAQRPRTVISILCESCWSDANNFAEAFSPLMDEGFKPFRAISPVYGGGTVNAEFEMQTGLPAAGSTLTGVLYQEYASLMKDNVDTVASRLRNLGYYTVSLHNNARSFYQRDVVYPKFGSSAFFGIENMDLKGGSAWPADDAVLYEKALSELSKHQNNPVHMRLVTVHTHGTYADEQDHGEGDYLRRLTYSVKEMAKFIKTVRAIDSDSLFLVYGDHKPALNRFFFERGILGAEDFLTTGDTDLDFRLSPNRRSDVVGDVPAFVLSNDPALTEKFITKAQALPLYCLSQAFSEVFLSVQTVAHQYAKKVCWEYASVGYERSAESFPSWLFSLSILNQHLLD